MPAAETLDLAKDTNFSERVFRVALKGEEWKILEELKDDAEALSEALKFFKVKTEDLNDLLEFPFREPFAQGRFSDGSHAVFYSAIEKETAAAERAHHSFELINRTSPPIELRMHLIDCLCKAKAKDLRELNDRFPELVSEVSRNTFCQSVGAEAKSRQVEALIAKSVRKPGGSNIAVFERTVVTDPQDRGVVVLSIDPGSRSVKFSLPT